MAFAREVVLVDYLRSPFSRSRPKEPARDLLNEWRMDEVLAMLWKELIKRNNLDPNLIDEALTGTAYPVMEQFTYGGKFPAFLADLPFEVSCQQIDQQCGSALACVRTGALAIASGMSDVILCGGIEHMTHVPIGGGPYVKFPDRLANDPHFKRVDITVTANMGFTAEKLRELRGVSKEDMDKFAVRSHRLAAASREWLKGEILPIPITLENGEKVMLDYDQAVRGDTTMEQLAALKPAYKPGGYITAGNSSPLNAGATACIIMSKEKAKKLGLKWMATFVSFGMAGVDPTIMGLGPVPSSKKALEYAKMKVDDIDYWEINEAFSVVTINAIRELNIPNAEDKVNIHGGALAIGHPLGTSGIRLLGTLARILKEKKGKYGCATACEGGGQGVACIIKNE